jgi:hypothetical protein
VLREGDNSKGGVDDPSQDYLSGGVMGISLVKLLQGGDMISLRPVLVIEGAEDVVNGVKETTKMLTIGSGTALDGANVIIHIYILLLEGRLARLSRWDWRR